MTNNEPKVIKNVEIDFFKEMTPKQIGGLAIFYIIVVGLGVPFFFHYTKFSTFILFLANVDLIANTLSTSFPDFFEVTYNPNPDSLFTYLSFNIISLIALAGIFMYGLQMKVLGRSDWVTFESMVVVSIVTYTLPTALIPLITKGLSYLIDLLIKELTKKGSLFRLNIKNWKKLDKDEKLIKVPLSISIAIGFVFLEAFIIDNYVHTKQIDAQGKRLFGERFKNPLRNSSK